MTTRIKSALHLPLSIGARKKFGLFFLVLFLLPFCGVGCFTLVLSVRHALSGEWANAGFFLIFALFFGGFGFGLLAAIFYGRRLEREQDEIAAEHPDSPWLWRREWATGRIESNDRGALVGRWLFALFWNIISTPLIVVALPEELAKGNTAILVALFFPLAGLGLLVWALRATLRYRRYGISVFRMTQVPAPLGRALRGVIVTRTRIPANEGFKLTLSCVNRVTTRSGSDTSTSERMLWQDERVVRPMPAAGTKATAIPVTFALPGDARESSTEDGDNEIIWRLEVEADVPGVDYYARFALPVFRTADSQNPLTPEELRELGATPDEEYRPPADSKIRLTEALRRTEVFFPPARNPLVASFVTLFLIGWVAVVVWIVRSDEGGTIFAILFGLFAPFLAWAAARLWMGTTRVVVADSRLQVTDGYLGFGRTRTVPASEVERIEVTRGMQSGAKLWYDLKAVLTSGKKLSLGSSVPSKREAEWLANKIGAALEVDTPARTVPAQGVQPPAGSRA